MADFQGGSFRNREILKKFGPQFTHGSCLTEKYQKLPADTLKEIV